MGRVRGPQRRLLRGPLRTFTAIAERGDAAARLSPSAWLRAMLDVEAAHAEACAESGLIPAAAAEAIVAAARGEAFDEGAILAAGAESGSVAIPLVTALRAAVGEEHAGAVHFGLGSQDVIDTASMLVARRALEPILGDATAARDAAVRLARRHRDDPTLGWTLLQAALPTTFGLRAANWAAAIDAARVDLVGVRNETLAVQLGGAVGVREGLGERAEGVEKGLADRLGLLAPGVPWHTDRGRPLRLAGALARLAAAAAKIGVDVVLLAQPGIAEVRERPAPGRGGSSSIPGKSNPVAAVSARAWAARAPGLLADLAANASGELERAAGPWQSEATILTELLLVSGSAVAWAGESLGRLECDPERMRSALAAAGLEPGEGAAVAARLSDRVLRQIDSHRHMD